ncbi:BQ2448_1923 [Microbotryum intermedium]|uniref:Ubiquinone biosynthesis monooxygenase COQ6, mitochondrial n=1 Tax=Microbotryum intermedium TaxID=269621 RepID=A0A238FCN3_9BASI|nr:BQ2448_1923 [Microbotryum intermedium]
MNRASSSTPRAVAHSLSRKVVRARPFSCTLRCRAAAAEATAETHDIVVIGGGPAGCTLAAALGERRLGYRVNKSQLTSCQPFCTASNTAISSTHKVTLLEASSMAKLADWALSPGEYSNRVSSITAENVAFLSGQSHWHRYIGVWGHLDATRARGIEEMQVWDGLSDARITFNSPTLDSHDPFSPQSAIPIASTSSTRSPNIALMATLVENLNLQRACMRVLEGAKNFDLVDNKKVLSITSDASGWPVIEVGSGVEGEPTRKVRARLLIGADGFNSPVKTYSNIESFGWAYNNQGLVASLHISPAEMGIGMTTAWQRFLPEGPIAFLPLSDTASSLVWSTTPELAKAIKQLPLELMTRLVNSAFTLPYSSLSSFLSLLTSVNRPTDSELSDSLEALVAPLEAASLYEVDSIPEESPPKIESIQPGSVAAFPLRLSHVDSYLGMPRGGNDLRTALVGDAAHTIHPLAGQGLNMGLGDIQSLVKTLETAVQNGGDVGSYNSLKSYPRARYIPNHALLSACDHLASLYGSQLSPVVWARSTGLEIINELDSVKALLMGGAGAKTKGRGAGAWGLVADGIESVGQGVRMAKMVGGMALGQVMNRFGGRLAGRR